MLTIQHSLEIIRREAFVGLVVNRSCVSDRCLKKGSASCRLKKACVANEEEKIGVCRRTACVAIRHKEDVCRRLECVSVRRKK